MSTVILGDKLNRGWGVRGPERRLMSSGHLISPGQISGIASPYVNSGCSLILYVTYCILIFQ